MSVDSKTGEIIVTHPEWCTDQSEDHRENNTGVEFINECVGVVQVMSTCMGPKFGQVWIEGQQDLVSGQWHYTVESKHRIAHGSSVYSEHKSELDELLENLVAAREWIAAQVEQAGR